MHRVVPLTVAFITLTAAYSPAVAQTHDRRQETISVKGLDLNSREGVMLFMHRLDAAAAKVCGPRPDFRELEQSDAFNTCVLQAKGDAIAHLNNAQVNAVASGVRQVGRDGQRQTKFSSNGGWPKSRLTGASGGCCQPKLHEALTSGR
jgi:UrcA family protein